MNQSGSMLEEIILGEWLRECICSIHRRTNVYNLELSHLLIISEEVDTTVNVFGALTGLEILSQIHSSGVINKHYC